MRNSLLVFIVWLASLVVSASDSRFYTISDIFGVSVREVFSICKDSNDFIWGSGKTGMIRISENDLRRYNLPYSTTDNYFIRIAYHPDLLVAYTNNGQFFKYDELYDCFTPLADIRQLLESEYFNLNGAVIDPEERLWIGSMSGLFRYENEQLDVILEDTHVQYIGAYDDNHLFVATTQGIGLLQTEKNEFLPIYRYKVNNEIEVSGFLYDPSTELLWVGTISNRLLCYKKEGTEYREIPVVSLPQQPVLTIKKNSETSTLFVGIDGQGLWELTEKGESVLNVYKEDVNDPYSLSGNGVYDILIDDTERIWVATYTGGLSYMDKSQGSIQRIAHQINQSNSLINNFVNKVLEDSRGEIWFATNDGISRWNRTENKWYHYLQNEQDQAKVFLGLCEDNHGNIWAGTYSSGVYVLDGKTGRILHHYFNKDEKDGTSGRFISDLYKDSQGNIWMGGTRNIICYQEKEKKFRIYDQQPVYAIEELSPEKIVLACTYGLFVLDKEKGYVDILLNNILANDMVLIENDIWIATSGAGLIRYDRTNRITETFTTQSGLPSNYVNSLLQEGNSLWLGTENGLCRFSLADRTTYTYSNNYPLSGISFTTNSCRRLRDGNLIFGTNKGAVIFKPDIIGQSSSKAKIFFQDITVSGSSIRENDPLPAPVPINKYTDLILDYKQNNFILELLATGMYNTGAKFSWKIEGIDNDWSHPSDLRFITYTNLPSGNFRLMVRMYDNSISRIMDERSLSIRVIPPFWETWWFYLFFLLLALGIIFYGLRTYSNRLKQKHVRDKIRFFTNMAHDIRTSLTLISAPMEHLKSATELTDNSRYYLNLATDQSERLSLVATQLLDFEKADSGRGQLFPVMTDIVELISGRSRIFKTTAEKKEIEVIFESDVESYLTAVDQIKIEKVVDNLISNALKYSSSQSKVEIFLHCNKKEWSLEVKDHGLGISEQAKSKLFREFYRGDNKANARIVGSGIGLLLVKKYVTMHGGEITFESEENVGSSFRFTIPYRRTEETQCDTEASPAKIADRLEGALVTEDTFPEEPGDKASHILIAEDNTDLQGFLRHSLGERYKITSANDGNEAWELIEKQAPDLIISDVMMPGMDGFRLCEKIKSTFGTAHIPVILLTSLSEKTKQLEGLGLGADDYMTKPFDISLLIRRIESTLRNREIIREKTLMLINRPPEDQPLYANALNDRFMKKALEVIHENISNCNFGKEEFASYMNVSPSLLYQKLKSLTGQSPLELIRTIRFNYAMELLNGNEYSTTEISELCGFASVNYFSTAFKRYFGKTPAEIRKN